MGPPRPRGRSRRQGATSDRIWSCCQRARLALRPSFLLARASDAPSAAHGSVQRYPARPPKPRESNSVHREVETGHMRVRRGAELSRGSSSSKSLEPSNANWTVTFNSKYAPNSRWLLFNSAAITCDPPSKALCCSWLACQSIRAFIHQFSHPRGLMRRGSEKRPRAGAKAL